MRVIAADDRRADQAGRRGARALNIELLGLVGGVRHRALRRRADAGGEDRRGRTPGPRRNRWSPLHALSGPADLEPLLTMFESPTERQAVARALYRRAADDGSGLEHVGGACDGDLAGGRHSRRPPLRATAGATGAPARRASSVAGPVPSRTSSVDQAAARRPHVGSSWREPPVRVVVLLAAFWLAHAGAPLAPARRRPGAAAGVMLLCGHRPDDDVRAAGSDARHHRGGDVRRRHRRRA